MLQTQHLNSQTSGFVKPQGKSKAFTDQVIKYARLVQEVPFSMQRAGDALLAWVTGTRPQEPPLDIGYCIVKDDRVAARVPVDLPAAAQPALAGAVGVEPALADVRVQRPGLQGPPGDSWENCWTRASARGRFVCPAARTLVESHGYEWQAAIEVANRCFDRLDPGVKLALGAPQVREAEAAAAPAEAAVAAVVHDSDGEPEVVMLATEA